MNKRYIHGRAICEDRKQNCEFPNSVWKSEWIYTCKIYNRMTQKSLDTIRLPHFSIISTCVSKFWTPVHFSRSRPYSSFKLRQPHWFPELNTTINTPYIIQFHLLPGILLELEDGTNNLVRNVDNNYQHTLRNIAEDRKTRGNMLNTSVK